MKVFISHASEDKDLFVRPLAEELSLRRLEIWYDEFVLKPGDSLRESIEIGLRECDYGIVVLSKAFFAKRWPQQELNGLFGRDLGSQRRFLIPIWYEINADKVRSFAPMLADRVALSSSIGVTQIAKSIFSVLIGDERTKRSQDRIPIRHEYAHRYYNPPHDIPNYGYELNATGFLEMVSQLRKREVLMAYESPYGSYYCAVHVTDEERMLGIEKDWQVAPRYFAVDVRKLIGGFDMPIPQEELLKLLED